MLYDALARPVERIYKDPEEKVGVTDVNDLGAVLDEHKLKKGLRELNQHVHFDLGACINKFHPRIDEWQGVYYNGQHICAMDRDIIPEYNVWGLNKFGDRVKLLRVGWRTTLELLSRENLPNLSWDAFCLKFSVDKKYFMGEEIDLKKGM